MSVKLCSKENVIYLKDFVEVNGCKYYVDGKKVILEPSKREINMAVWLMQKLNTNIYILPKVLLPEGVKTADYLINNENWDLKRIKSTRNTAIYTSIRKQKRQSSNFIFDVSRTKVTIKSAKYQVEDLFKHKDFKWFKNAIIKKNDEYVIINRPK